ncbi:ABC transporter ATP-binding protein [Microbacterium pseudoresistens]|uniref:NitT/TauT family transport system ATP-binding protein n=1 Tax=Microbacterium pseudoresistens TaxID=640634 RepID=A0A7Y9EVJ6_9MICO|nr:ABC transporter ATP-binding protein [Microbacterium pseudoresistens]NYD53870.1 NitT/TauT family transport system ATP-binding protein [Microbacterium pseudoresistens]
MKSIDLEVPKGQFLCLVGPSGCGKTTLLNMISGALRPERGSVNVNTQKPRASAVGYMFARDSLMPWRPVRTNVAYALELRGVRKQDRLARADEMLELVGLGGKGHLHPQQLSHGMRQRANLARTLALDPELMLVDEPFGALDAQTKARLQGEFLRIWEGTGKTVIFVTHDLSEAALIADRIVVMGEGEIRKDITVDFERPRDLDKLRFASGYQDLVHSLWGLFSSGEEQ